MNKQNDDLILLEIGSRLNEMEQTLSDIAMMVRLLVPIVATLQEQTLYRVQEMNKKNAN